MTLSNKFNFLKKNASPVAVGGGVGVLIIFLLIIFVLATTEQPFIESAHSKEITMKIQGLAKSVKGDAKLLKQEDFDWLQQMSSGHANSIIDHMYREPRYK